MSARTYGIAAAVLGLGAAFWLGRNHPAGPGSPTPPSPGSLQPSEELSRLRSEVAALRARLAERQTITGQQPRRTPRPAPAAAPSRPPAPASDRLAEAKTALACQDGQAFLEAFFALLDAGESGSDPLLALLGSPDLEGFFFDAEDDPKLTQAFFRGLTGARAQRAAELVDAVLVREGVPDRSTANALTFLLQFGVEGSLPRERRIALLTGLLEKSPKTAEGAALRDQAAEALGRFKAHEALPLLEKLIAGSDPAERWRLLETVQSVGGAEALAVLKRLRSASGDAPFRDMLDTSIGSMRGEEANAYLWDRIAAERDPARRSQLWQALALRPENTDRVTKLVGDPATEPAERGAMIEGLISVGATKAVWTLYDVGGADLRQQALAALAGHRDPRALDLVIQGLGEGHMPAHFAGYVAWVDAEAVTRNQAALRAAVGNADIPAGARGQMAWALGQVDKPGAVRALQTGFQGLSEGDRLETVRVLGLRLGGPEAKAFLEQVGASDPSETVRKMAEAFASP